ncbi:MAG: beta-ketoacyl synthase N-terminal-like domain-containing protein, partial [Deferribacterota bacterium]|nr:beta-ketoacyl synthase N-terminal-like domain-containing protein [Deferribacterota bacterium]
YWFIEDYYDPDPFAPGKTYCKRGAFIPEIDFDPIEFSIPPANVEHTDTSQLLGLIVAKKVLEDAAAGQFNKTDKDKISVILGVGGGLELLGEMTSSLQAPVIERVLKEEGYNKEEIKKLTNKINKYSKGWRESTFPGLLTNVVSGRIANRFDLHGTNCTVDAACASSFASLHLAVDELLLGQSDLVITGGIDTLNNPFMFICFSKTPALSFSNDCRPFSDKADGMMLGEGLGLVALKRLEDAEKDGDKIYAVIRGVGTSSDGKAKSIYAPHPEGQAIALRRCYDSAGYLPSTVDLVEAHGTGTRVGDIAEFQSLNTVFKESGRKDLQWCALGTVKSQIGHTKSAAAAAGLIKAVLAINHRVLPPTIKVDKPDPKMDFKNSALYLNTETRPWVRNPDYPRRASVSSFGFGGTNYHVTIEEYTDKTRTAKRLRYFPYELFLFSGSNDRKISDELEEIKKSEPSEELFRYLSKSSQLNFNPNEKYKLAIIAKDYNDLVNNIDLAKERILSSKGESFSIDKKIHFSNNGKNGKIAFLFPGQGSQYLNMSSELSMFFDETINTWDDIAKIDMGDVPLNKVVFPIPVFTKQEEEDQEKRLIQTEWAQPAIASASLSLLSILKKVGIEADFVGGHSLGEITALFDAGVVSFEDVIKIARKRGELMSVSSDEPATMTAVKAPYEKITDILKELNTDVVVANYNTPDQIVLSGSLKSIELVEGKLKQLDGIPFKRLNVSTAFHSPLMKNAEKPFSQFIDTIKFNKPIKPIYSNVTSDKYPSDISHIKELIVKQLISSVRFVDEVRKMYDDGAKIFIEVGPNSVLTNLTKQCLSDKDDIIVVNTMHKSTSEIKSLWNALGVLSVNGLKIKYENLWQEYAELEDPRKKEKPKFTIKLRGYNHGRKYPPEEEIEKRKKLGKNYFKDEEDVKDEQEKVTNINEVKKAFNRFNKNQDKKESEGYMAKDKQKNIKENLNYPKKQDNNLRPIRGDRKVYPSVLQAFMEMQRQATIAYTTFQKTMSESHLAFMKSAETSTRLLGQLMGAADVGSQIKLPEYKIDDELEKTIDIDYKSAQNIEESRFYDMPEEAQYESYDYEKEDEYEDEYIEEEPEKDVVEKEELPAKEEHVESESGKEKSQEPAAQPEVVEKFGKEAAEDLEKLKAMSEDELKDLIFDIVVDKTGYPKE